MRIDQENLKLARRIVSQKPVLSRKDMDKDYLKFSKTKAFLIKDKSLDVSSIINT